MHDQSFFYIVLLHLFRTFTQQWLKHKYCLNVKSVNKDAYNGHGKTRIAVKNTDESLFSG